jgi:PPM family protein phosphatase
MSLEGKIELVGLTDVGRKRSHNEDTIGSDPSLGVAILADGMGGYRAGEVASAIAVKLIMDELREGLGKLRAGEIDDETGFSRETLLIKTAIEKANEAIYQTAQSQPQCHGMGTTVVTAAFYDDRVTIAHVGDSRLYRMREGLFEQVTSDHSLRQELVDKGFYTPEEARSSLNKNLVTRAIGIEMTVNPDLQEDVVKPGDVYLMCSDGLSDPVSDEVMQEILTRHLDDLPAAARSLVEQANENGGKDNISVILVRSLAPFGARRRWYSRFIDWF